MVAVTIEDLEQAERAAERAQGELREAERGYASNRASRTAYDRHKEAVEAADHAAVRARLLREEWQQQEAAREVRATAGREAAEAMAGDVQRLVDARAAAVAAVLGAASAMGRALDALGEFDGAVREAGGKLAERGLLTREGEETGAHLDGSAWIAGRQWPLIDAGGVLADVLRDLVLERWPRHPLARLSVLPYGGATAGRGREEVVATVREGRAR
ncbi:hypothetical protein [Streptomyces griseosporeus]|uniref:hypothetical protein n=1 Tax=Streptomyces griseosporeus TaxID=1910 RepID=UPI00167F1CA4|nr:hypothetical protein [Streptomyces griseosporeus]GHF57750.1 hypothetical protein GCM10018783_28910 [Streptomyces griseosporeus]